MDTRLIFTFLLTGIVCALTISCKSIKKETNLNKYHGLDIVAAERMRGETEADYWIRTYKQQVFYSCLTQNFKNDSVFVLMGKEDFVSNPSDIIPFSFWKKIDSVGKNAIRYMKKNEFISDNPEDRKLNFISGTCLNYYTSKELDSIAKCEFKKYLKDKSSKH